MEKVSFQSSTVKYSEAKEIMKAAFQVKEPVYLSGPPGCGKSALGWELAQELTGYDPIDIRTTLIDPVDLKGIPTLNRDGLTHWATPDFLPREGRVIIFEELANAPQSVQSACLQPIYDRCLGDWKMHPDSWIMGTGNRVQDRAGSSKLISSLRNRMLILELEASLDDWLVWAGKNNVPIKLKQFLRFRPGLFSAFDPEQIASPTARGWWKVSKLLPVLLSTPLRLPAISGLVGQGAGIELESFLKVCDNLPDAKKILEKPEKAPIPTDPATMYALIGALNEIVTLETVSALMTYALRVSEKGMAEFSILIVQELLEKDKKMTVQTPFRSLVCQSKPFQVWIKKNANFILPE